MNEDEFWQLIENSHGKSEGDTSEQLEILREELEKLAPEKIISFERIFDKFYRRSDDWKLWAAAYLINGGCSDDGFDYFRAGLILQGKKVFKAALVDPESLIEVINFEDGDLAEDSSWASGVEEFTYLASKVYEEKTGSEIPSKSSARKNPSGEEWAEDRLEELLPKLTRYCEEAVN